MDLARVLELFRALADCRVDYVLVGGVAINLHGIPRATQDVDLFVRPEAANVERLKDALRRVFADPHIDEISVEDLAGDYPTVRYVPPSDPFVVDLLSRLGEAFAFDDIAAESLEVEGVPVRVATPATLHRMKRDTIRAVDRADAEALARKFDLGGGG